MGIKALQMLENSEKSPKNPNLVMRLDTMDDGFAKILEDGWFGHAWLLVNCDLCCGQYHVMPYLYNTIIFISILIYCITVILTLQTKSK